jgi:hypothetical protein
MTSSMPPLPHLLRHVAVAVVTAGAGLGACSLSLLSGERPVLTVGAAGAVAVLGAVLSGWRWLGSAATVAASATVLFAAGVTSERITGWHLVAASALLVVMVAGLDRVERSARSGRPDVVRRAPASRWLLVPVLGLLAGAVVAWAAARPAVPSVGLLLLGLAAGVAALVLATSTT